MGRSTHRCPLPSATSPRMSRWPTSTATSCPTWWWRAPSRTGYRSCSTAAEEVLQQPLALDGQDRLGVELHAEDRQLAVAQRHDLLLPGLGGHLEHRRKGRRLDDQRVIPRGL